LKKASAKDIQFAKVRPLPGETTVRFQEKQIQLVVGLINIVVAAILIIGAVVSLFKLRTMPDPVRLVMIAAFTSLFAVSVGLLTNAKRAEIFASTAAYAAVLVVIVSGDLGGSSNNA
jgi:FtsH-binding integral membrane protein